jgi:hypothetical protein
MKQGIGLSLVAVLAAALSLAGCQRSDTAASAENPNATDHGGASVVAGASGGGPAGGAAPQAQPAQPPGVGLQGGLGASGSGMTGSFPAQAASGASTGPAPAPAGSTNSTPGSSVGTR